MLSDLKSLVAKMLAQGKGLQYQRQLSQQSLHVPTDGIFLNYSNVISSVLSNYAHGGMIKLRHLQEEFPENSHSFNILYLVSSAHPPFAKILAQWAKRKGAKLVWNQDGVAYPAWAGKNTKIQNKEMNRLIHLADYVIYQSAFCQNSSDLFLGPVQVPFEILPNCVDLERFAPREEPLPQSPWILLTAGTHQQSERVLIVLRTLAVLRERKRKVRLILAGKLDWLQAENEVDETIQRLDLGNLVLRQPVFTQDEAPALYQKAHICIHAKYKDPCPTVVIEAMACGLPVIGSESGGLPELVGQEGGVLLDVPDSWDHMYYPEPEKIADAVEIIFSDYPNFRLKARERARVYFSKDRWLERHRHIFQKILRNGG